MNLKVFLIGSLVISLIVTIHEFGHYIFARMNGVGVEVFSVGMGKPIWKRYDSKGTLWQLCILPLGGYILPKDDGNPVDPNRTIPVSGKCFRKSGMVSGILVAIAGPLFNFLTAFCCFVALNNLQGVPKPSNIISNVQSSSIADKIGIKEGDVIVEVNGVEVNRFIFLNFFKENISLKVERSGELVSFNVNKAKRDLIGVSFKTDFQKMSFIDSVFYSCKTVYELVYKTLATTFQAITGLNFMGPIGIIKSAGKANEGGFYLLILFIAHLSIAIGAFNLIPIPLLDGGRILMFLVSGIIRRPVPEKIEGFLNYLSIAVLGFILIVGSFLDIKGLIWSWKKYFF